MPLRIRESNGVSLIDIEGNVDINSSDIIETVAWLVNSGKLRIVLNLENVDMVDYSGLSVLAIAYKKVVNQDGKLKFLHVPLAVMELLRIVRLDAVFETYTSEEAALNSFYQEDVEKLRLRRKFKRLDMHLKVRYRIKDSGKDAKTYEGEVLNISGAGVYIYNHSTFPLDSQLDLEFILPDSHVTFAAVGKVAWLSDRQIQPHSYPGMGVAFVHLTSEKERSIADFIDKNITFRADP